jgi:hypothetical protein
MAKISTPAISLKTYRHFAVVTVAVTLLLAIFSTGENRQAIAKQIAAQQAAAKQRRNAIRAKYGTPRLVKAPQQSSMSYHSFYGRDDTGTFGAPMDQAGSTVQDVGPLGIPPQDCARGFLLQEARSDEDPEGPPVMKCLRRKSDEPARQNAITAAERREQINGLVSATLRNTPGAGAGN